MRIQKHIVSVETSGVLASQTFSVRDKDMGFILDILRSKMYNDPIKAMVREVMANARDAHREVGCPDKPIQVVLPTEFSKQLEIRDWGPGISPRRMGEIFLNYGASTKRRSNVQTGGFGLGAKTPFAYGDSFSIVTIYNGKKRHYNSYIDETNCGNMDLVSEDDVDEPNSTAIIIPIKENDFERIAREVVSATTFWNDRHGAGPQPDIVNVPTSVVANKSIEIRSSGDSWDIISDGSNKKIIAVVDGVEYGIDLYKIDKSKARTLTYLPEMSVLYFPVGALSLAANRDSLHYDDRTIKALNKAADKFLSELANNIRSAIETCETLKEAEKIYSIYNDLFKDPPTWRTFKLNGFSRYPKSSDNFSTFICYERRYSYRGPSGKVLDVKKEMCPISFKEDNKVYINDLDSQHGLKTRIGRFMERNDLSNVFVLSFADQATKDRWYNELGFEHFCDGKVSDIPKPPRNKRASNGTRTKRTDFNIWKFDLNYSSTKSSEEFMRPITIEKDRGGIFVELVSKRDAEFNSKNEVNITPYCIKIIKNLFPELEIYIIPSAQVKSLDSSWKRLEVEILDALKEKVNSYSTTELDIIDTSSEARIRNVLGDWVSDIKVAIKNGEIKNIIADYILEEEKVEKLFEDTRYISLARRHFSHLADENCNGNSINLDINKLKALATDIRTTYPLLRHMRYPSHNDLIDYIKIVDFYNEHNANQAICA